MNKDEVFDIIDYLDRAFPRGARPDASALDVWVAQLARIDHADALRAAERLPAELDLFPTIAQLVSRAREFSRQREMSRPLLPQPESSGPKSDRVRAAWVAQVRRQLAGLDLSTDRDSGQPGPSQRHTGEHWDACPACISTNAEVHRAIAQA